jgi:hypothetical protein
VGNDSNSGSPITHQRDLAKLPRALAPLIERPQWAVWRWTQRDNGSWQKPPFMAAEPQRHASTKDPSTWSDYATALATVQAGHADGISYILTAADPFGAIDLDHCRDPRTHSIDVWAQNFMQCAVTTYQEVTPSGDGIRIWGLANGEPLHRKFTLEIDDKGIAAELFRCTNKPLTITGYTLDPAIKQLTNIDKALSWAVVWGERRKAAAAEVAAPVAGNGFNSDGCRYTIDQIEAMTRNGAPPGSDRSAVFHAIIGHLSGCGWDAERIFEHVGQFPDGIGAKYIAEGRLTAEIARSLGKYQAGELPLFSDGGWVNGWKAKQPEKAPAERDKPELEEPLPKREPEPEQEDPELNSELDPDLIDDEGSAGFAAGLAAVARPRRSRSAADQELADQTADSGCRARTVERPVGCRQNLRGV